MKAFIACLLLTALLGVVIPLSFARQNQNTQKPDPEIETLKKRISVLESQLQIVENVEKMELAAKLADANTKLINAEFGKLERELKDTNNEWLRTWSLWFAGIIGFLVLIVGGAFWFWLRSRADQLIEDEVEKSLNGFKEGVAQVDTLKNELKEAVGQVNILQDQIRMLEKEHAASVLENFMNTTFSGFTYPQSIEALGKEILLQVFGDEKYRLPIREKAVEVLAAKKSPRLVSPVLEFLNSVVDSDFDSETSIDTGRLPYRFVSFVGQIYTEEAHQGLKKFLNRLLTENPKHKHLFLAWTAFFLADIDVELGLKDSVSVMKKVIPDLDNPQRIPQVLSRLVEYFDAFSEPEGIKEILTHHAADRMPEVETRCLELLQKCYPKFVEEWKAEKETTNTENKESS